MSDDEEMTDMSQVITQSGSITFTSLSLSNKEPDNEPWGKIIVSKIVPKRLGRHVASYESRIDRTLELVRDKTVFGRSPDCDVQLADFLEQDKLSEISNTHFSIIKINCSDPYSPAFLEDTSRNGTYFHRCRDDDKNRYKNVKRTDERTKRRILAHKDVIYVEIKPTIRLEFHSLQPTPNELPEDINRDYHIGKELGEGACGTVYFAQDRKTCQPYALKYTNCQNKENMTAKIMTEVNILEKLNHPCILQLFKFKTYVDSVAIWLGFMQGGDLLNRIQQYGPFSESFTKFLFYQICCGVEYLHSQNITHRDLKPENILLATTDQYTLVKVSDFGLSKCVDTNTVLKTQCGTRMYLAPEIGNAVRRKPYTNKVDIWSLGVVLYNCLTKRYPFAEDLNYVLKLDDYDGKWNNVSDNGQQIVREALCENADQRPSANEMLHQRIWLAKSDCDVQKAIEVMLHHSTSMKSKLNNSN